MMYLVVVRTAWDELPILLTGNRKLAFEKMESVSLSEIETARMVMQADHCELHFAAVITFKDGVAVAMDHSEKEIWESEMVEPGLFPGGGA